MLTTAAPFVAMMLAAVACGCDLRTRRIPQLLTVGGALTGFTIQLAGGGWSGAAASALGWLMGLGIFMLPFALGGLGAGDVKLLAALGAWLGPTDVVWLALYTGIAGGVLALLASLSRGYLPQALANIRKLFAYWRVAGLRPMPELTLEHRAQRPLPYAVPVLVGMMVTLWIR